MSEEKLSEGKRHQTSNLKDFGEIDVGDFFAGDEILRIISRTAKHLIYETHSGIAYSAIDIESQKTSYIAHLEQLKIQAKRKFKGVHEDAIRSYKDAIIVAIFCADEININKAIENFESFIKESSSVKNVVERRDNYVVWISEFGVEHWIKKYPKLMRMYYLNFIT